MKNVMKRTFIILATAMIFAGCAKPLLQQPDAADTAPTAAAAPVVTPAETPAPAAEIPTAAPAPTPMPVPQGGKQSIAIYMTGEEPAAVKGAHKVIGSELAKALTKSSAYTAVDRSQQAIEMIAIEHIYQRSGAVNDEQIKQLGVQIGAKFLCIAEISVIMGSYFLEARIVDVETAVVSHVASVSGDLRNAADVVRVSQEIALELVPEQVAAQTAAAKKKKGLNYTFREIEVNPNKAISDYSDAIRQGFEIAEYYFKRGFAYMCKDDYDLAIADFNYAIRLSPNDALYYFFRGVAYSNSRKAAGSAIADYSKAIQLNPNYTEAYNGRGCRYIAKGEYDSAIADFNAAIRQNPGMADAHFNRGFVYEKISSDNKGNAVYAKKGAYNMKDIAKEYYDLAMADYSETIRLDPNYEDAYTRRYQTDVWRKDNFSDFRGVIAACSDTIRRNPNNAPAYLNRGFVYYYMREKNKSFIDSALADLNEAVQLNRNLAVAYYTRGRVHFDLNDYSRALADYSDAIRVNPEYSSAYSGRGRIYYINHDYNRAEQDYKTALKINPNNEGARFGLSEIRKDLKEYDFLND